MLLQTPGIELGQIVAIEHHVSCGRSMQTQQRTDERALAAARFAHERHRLARGDIETDIVHCMHVARADEAEPAQLEPHLQMAGGQQRNVGTHCMLSCSQQRT